MSERALTKAQVISELTKSPHGKLEAYVPIGRTAASEDPEFFGHLVAWNHVKGQIRDAKVALPILALTARDVPAVFVENALAHLSDFNPRMFEKALTFARTVKAPQRTLRRLAERYLRDLEMDGREWERTAIQHRNTLKGLYARYHVKPSPKADIALFKGHGEGKFAILRALPGMTASEIAGAIEAHKLPFMVVRGALGAKAKDPDVVMALMARMSPTELVTNTKALERLGVKTVPALRAAFEAAIERAGKAKRGQAILKTTRAAEALADDEKLSGKLRALQEKQIDNLRGIEGNWLVLADKSGSMEQAIELSKEVAAVLGRCVKGTVNLVFFDTEPRGGALKPGITLEEIKANTQFITASGGTSIGCGLQLLLENKIAVDGIAIVSDGGENTPPYFGAVYRRYCDLLGIEPSVYLYQTRGESDAGFTAQCSIHHVTVQRFDLRGGSDYYALPNLVQTMRVGRYQLLDEVLATPLRTLDDVLERTKGMKVWHVAGVEAARPRSVGA